MALAATTFLALLWACTFLFAASMAFRFDLHEVEAKRKAKRLARQDGEKVSAWKEVLEGLAYIRRHPMVRSVMVGMGTALLGAGAVFAIGINFAEKSLGVENGFGLLQMALGVGASVGMFLLGIVGQRLPRDTVFAFSLVFAGGALFVSSLMTAFPLALMLVGALGAFAGAAYVTGFSLLHEEVRDEVRGRIFAALFTIVRLCLMLSLAGSPLLSQGLDSAFSFDSGPLRVLNDGVRLTLALGGAVIAASGLFTAAAVRKYREGRHYLTGEIARPQAGVAGLALGFHTADVHPDALAQVRAEEAERAARRGAGGPGAIPITEYIDMAAAYEPPAADELARRRRHRDAG